MFGIDFDLVSFVLGNVTGFTVAVVMGRRKFARVQEEARDLYKSLVVERSLNEGLTSELDALSLKSTRTSRTAKK